MLLNEYISKNQKNIKTFQHKNPSISDGANPKIFFGVYVNEDKVLKYKSLGIQDDPTSVEDSEIKILKGQTIALFDQPIALSSRSMENYKEVDNKELLSKHIEDIFSKIKKGVLPPTVNLLEKYHGKEDVSPQPERKEKITTIKKKI
jgi:hypothetical protein